MTAVDDLLDYIFDGKRPRLYTEVEDWVRRSRRFRAFAASYRDKIRAKLRNVRDPAGMQDVRAELEAASVLLREDRFTLEYEKYAAEKIRGPDFTVTYRTHTPFNVEVRRIGGVEFDWREPEVRIAKVVAVLLDKVGQMPPSIINVLWLATNRASADIAVTRAVTDLRERISSQANSVSARPGPGLGVPDLRQYRRLSGIALYRPGGIMLWLNPLARHPVPPDISRALERLETA